MQVGTKIDKQPKAQLCAIRAGAGETSHQGASRGFAGFRVRGSGNQREKFFPAPQSPEKQAVARIKDFLLQKINSLKKPRRGCWTDNS